MSGRVRPAGPGDIGVSEPLEFPDIATARRCARPDPRTLRRVVTDDGTEVLLGGAAPSARRRAVPPMAVEASTDPAACASTPTAAPRRAPRTAMAAAAFAVLSAGAWLAEAAGSGRDEPDLAHLVDAARLSAFNGDIDRGQARPTPTPAPLPEAVKSLPMRARAALALRWDLTATAVAAADLAPTR